MKWVTRRRVQVNRAATAWLVKRFLEPDAEFLFVDADQVAGVQEREGAVGFDAPGATYPHEDTQGRGSFEALVHDKLAGDPVLVALARIVRGADFDDQLELTPESSGLQAISRGFPLVTRDDHETMAKAGFVYDALYASIKKRLETQGGR